MSGAPQLPILVLSENPALSGLSGALWAQGLDPIRIGTTEEARAVGASHRGRCIALLDTYRPARYSFAAVYQLLHDDAPVPTLLVLGAPGTDALARNAPPTDDCITLPMDFTEIARRARGLAEQAGYPLPRVAEAAVATMAPRAPIDDAAPAGAAAEGSAMPADGGAAVRVTKGVTVPTAPPPAGAGRSGWLLGGLLLVALVALALLALALGGDPRGRTVQGAEPADASAAAALAGLFRACRDAVDTRTWDAAVAACERVYHENPRYPGAADTLAAAYVGAGRQALADGGQVEAALAQFQRALEVAPDDRDALEESRRASRYLEGDAALIAKDWPTAADRFGQVFGSARGYLGGLGERSALNKLYAAEVGWGEALRAAGSYGEARRHCARALDLVPNGAEAGACVAAINEAQPPTPIPTVAPRPTRGCC